jgi:hypothetical protein
MCDTRDPGTNRTTDENDLFDPDQLAVDVERTGSTPLRPSRCPPSRACRTEGRAIPVAVVAVLGAVQLLRCSISSFTTPEEGLPTGIAGVDGGSIDAGPLAQREPAAPDKEALAPPTALPVEVATVPVAAPSAAEAKRATSGSDPVVVSCPDDATARVRLLFSPAAPVAGKPLRVTAVAEDELDVAGIELAGTAGRSDLEPLTMWGGPPWSWSVTLESAPVGTHRFLVASGDPAHPHACGEIEVVPPERAARAVPGKGIWPVERAWDRGMENLYAAWIGRLFRVDPGARAGWRPLHTVLHDPKRNFLYGHLGLDEDNTAAEHSVVAGPDCGDTPFFLRAYFAWKLRLPYAVQHCLRGTREKGTRCDDIPETNLDEEWDAIESPVERFNMWLEETVGDTVHSGTGRVLPEAAPGALYPVALSRETLRPGVVFVDPGGHVLVVSQWVPGTRERIGMLLAIDAHPDRTVSHKRFSRANFFFDAQLRTGGFKAFRPVIYAHGRMRFASDAELAADPGYPDLSLQQYELPSTHAFYRTIDVLLNPEPLDPLQAYRSHMEALVELLEERVSAVQVGVEYQKETDWATIDMPLGGEIFETTGPWEDYSTPARDLRLLLAMDEMSGFAQYVMDNPAIFRIPAGKAPGELARELAAEWRRSSTELGITYARSDGTTWRLDLAEIVDRMDRFEQSYNPNDCPEQRWGAAKNTPEFATCDRFAPDSQRRRMEKYRWWHHERFRPSAY